MAGTYAEQVTLASSNDFQGLVKVSLLKRAIEIDGGSDRQSIATLQLVRNIMQTPTEYATKMAWLVATGNATIAAAAPAVPSENDTQYAVNTLIPKLV